MSLLDQASLVLVPSAYRTGEVLVQKPLPTKFSDETGNYDGNDPQGSANLTFTRNSNATRVNSDGLVEKVRTNYLLNTGTFSGWSLEGGTIVGGFADPEGGTSAYKYVQSTGGLYSGVAFTDTSSKTMSVYLKSVDGTSYNVTLGDGATGGTVVTVTNTWQRFHCKYTSGSSRLALYVYGIGNTGGVLLWHPQGEISDFGPTDYIPTTTSARSTFAGISVDGTSVPNVPRLDYSGGCPSLLLEPQRTNSALWSEQIDNAGWTKINAPTITTNIATAPDGYGGADGIQDTTGSNFKRIRQLISVSANSTNTASVFVKKETSQTNFGGLSMGYTGGSARYAYGIINPITGTIVVSTDSLISSSSTKVEDFGDWWRFSLTTTDNGGNTTIEIAYYSTLSNNGTTAGVGAGSVRTIWGLQLELGASYASSYIPTLGASVTRLADAAYKTGISSLIGQTEGTIFLDFDFTNAGKVIVLFTIHDNANNKRIELWADSARLNGFIGGSVNITVGSSTITNGRHKVALAYKQSGDHAFYIDGVQISTSSTAYTISALTGLAFDFWSGAGGVYTPSENVHQALLFKTRLPNATLANLTAL